jgi:hypothetical protein
MVSNTKPPPLQNPCREVSRAPEPPWSVLCRCAHYDDRGDPATCKYCQGTMRMALPFTELGLEMCQ